MGATRVAPRTRALALVAAVGLLAGACSGGSGDAGADDADDTGAGDASASAGAGDTTASARSGDAVYPGDEWARGDAAEAGFDPAALEEIAAEAERRGSTCLVVTRHGRVVADWYWDGAGAADPQEVLSITKSVTGTLVGIAEARGQLDLDDRVSEYVPEWRGTPSEDVTIEDILANRSGRHWDRASDYEGLPTAPDRTAFAVGLGQDAAPGETWFYNNAAIQSLEAVLAEATGQGTVAFAREALFAPLGMAASEMTEDGSGNGNMFFGLQSTCEDLARFGYLYLRGGEWDGTEVVPADYVEAATGGPSQGLNAAYGYLWWLNRRGPAALDPMESITAEQAEAAPDRQMVEGAPEGMFWAWGLGGQYVQVDPGSGTVVVRLGGAGDTYPHAEPARVVTEALVEP